MSRNNIMTATKLIIMLVVALILPASMVGSLLAVIAIGLAFVYSINLLTNWGY